MAHQQKKILIDSIIYDEKKMNSCMKSVAENIRRERGKKELSISGLAERANLSASCISKAEMAHSSVSLKSLIKIAAALEVPIAELLKTEEETASNASCLPPVEYGRLEQMVKNLPEEMKNFLAEMTMELMRTLDAEKHETEE